MSVKQYLEEGGGGAFAKFVVPDLVSLKSEVALLLILESPHIDELRTGTPLSGESGQAALRVLEAVGDPPEALASTR